MQQNGVFLHPSYESSSITNCHFFVFLCLSFEKPSGRLDKLLYVPLPSPPDRVSILKALASKVNLAADVDLEAIATVSRADGYSGADCAALLREAGLAVLRDGSILSGKRSVGSGGVPAAVGSLLVVDTV